MTVIILFLGMAGATEIAEFPQPPEFLERTRAFYPAAPEWDKWLVESKEIPKEILDFPAHAPLLNPLVSNTDWVTPISTPDAWRLQRERILAELQKWILGTPPPSPDNLKVEITKETIEDRCTSRKVLLSFGPKHKAHLKLELLLPEGNGPFPVFMTQTNHRGWALVALRRGYACCVYAACDIEDDTDSFVEPYAEYDWSRLTRRAWATSRCIDYLATLPEVRMDQIAVTGHSRNGKLSLIASALDERIAVTISSSSGAGGSIAIRAMNEDSCGEGIEHLTRAFPDWFHPRWRFFLGRENRLPVDLNELVALSAPRACLISTAINDDVESTWAIEKTFLSVKPVYALYKAEDRFRILWRSGGHETCSTTIERYVDWCDKQFGRGDYAFPERFYYPHDWNAWRKRTNWKPSEDAKSSTLYSPECATPAIWKKRAVKVREAVVHSLGTALPASHSRIPGYGRSPEHVNALLGHGENPPSLEVESLMFGDYINGDIYAPSGTKKVGKRVPAILWIHPWCTSSGYDAAYHRGEQPRIAFAKAGFAVFCYDQPGCGRRVEELENFETRYPDASILGILLRDARAALDAIERCEYVDKNRIFVVGYATGAYTAAHLAAMDDRPAGYALVSPPPPFRLDMETNRTGGFRRWSLDSMLHPQMGFFVEDVNRAPYDIDELYGLMAPKPLLLVTSELNWRSPPDLTGEAVKSARKVYAWEKATDKITQLTPKAYNHFDSTIQELVVDWLSKTCQLSK